MKKLHYTILVFFFLTQHQVSAQSIHWRGTEKDSARHLISAVTGADYTFHYGLSYGYVIPNKWIPLAAGAEFTVPFGNTVFDDWKGRLSLQAELWKNNNLALALVSSFVFRRYASPMARIYNTGLDLTLTFGYVKPKWGVVALATCDRSLASNIRHEVLKEYYPEIRDGWYGASGGTFKFGARANVALKSWNVFAAAGKHFGQDFNDNPTFPFFAELSIQKQFGKK